MFVLKRDVSASQKAIATLLTAALFMATVGYHSQKAVAADLIQVSNTITDSSPGATGIHTIGFTLPVASAFATGEQIVIDFPTGEFDVTSLTDADINVSVNGTPEPGAWDAVISADQVELTANGAVTTTAGAAIVIELGTSTTPANWIVNPADTAGGYDAGYESHEISISAGTAGAPEDTGNTRIVILQTVLVTAEVPTLFEFYVEGRDPGFTINGQLTNGTSSSTTIPFGVLDHDATTTIAQDLRVISNAANGFVVTVQTDGDFESTNGGVIDTFTDGTDVAVPTNWAAPLDNIALDNTWGHWGVTSADNDGLYGALTFGADQWVAATVTPTVMMAHDGPADGVEINVGSTTVAYRVEITPLQEAADDYQTTLTYIATPTF